MSEASLTVARRPSDQRLGEPLLVDLRLHFLQQWRLVQAMAEGRRAIRLRPDFAAGIDYLNRYFETGLQIGEGTPLPAGLIGINTLGPKTTLGKLSRALIIPHAVVRYCRSLWPAERDIRFSFAGHNHWGRSKTLSRWHADRFAVAAPVRSVGEGEALVETARTAAGASPIGTAILFSKRGRAFPQKVWDDDYFRLLAASTFSLCPDGDQIWSYRFFESCLCGAIPIVQSDWPTYAGFRFLRLDDPIDRLIAHPEDQAHNFELARSRLTVPIDELDEELRAF